MREVIVAKSAGFCFGVKRAVETVYAQVESGKKPIYTYGPIIHNEQVVSELAERGVRIIENRDELRCLRSGTVIIRSHGAGPDIYKILEENGVEIVDATCPFVKKIHKIAQEQSKNGRRVLIIGDPNHAEVQGIRGWGDERTRVLADLEDIDGLNPAPDERLCIVAQTTFNLNKFQVMVEKITEKGYDILVLNTICNATQERQVEARRIASEVDAMIVIGGKHSSNTQKLFEICQKECKNTYFVHKPGDFNSECVNSVRCIGITAGASTPNQIIEEVHARCRN